MFRAGLVLAALVVRLASGQAPTYSSDSIANGANFAPGPFALNSVITIFGAGLSFQTAAMAAHSTSLPLALGGVSVNLSQPNISRYWLPLIYVSPTQINLLAPGDLKPGTATLYVERQSQAGPKVTITLAAVAPQLFVGGDNNVIAQHADYTQITPKSPARAGEVIILYGTGLGLTQPHPVSAEIPQYAGLITTGLQVLLNGSAVGTWAAGGGAGTDRILYAGLTPGSAGVYQINLTLPDSLPSNPEIRLSAGDQMSTAGVMLPAQQTAP